MRVLRLLSVLSFVALSLSGCALLAIGVGGAAVGVSASQEGGLSRAASDARIQVQINDLWFKEDVDLFGKLDMTVNDGRVLLTGVVQDPDHRVQAVRLAWQPKGVKQVINEIRIAEGKGITGYARDSWISTRLRAATVFNKNVQSLNYTIDTVQGTVYLMGVAQSQEELDRVITIARTIDGVQQVVSYVKIPDPLSDGGAPIPLED